MPEEFTPDSPEMRIALDATREPSYAKEVASADVDAAWAKARAKVDRPAHERPRNHPYRGVFWALAASIIVVCGVVLSRGRVTTYVALPGQRMAMTLADGTRVTLAAGSRLVVPAGYAGGDRMTQLDGEAYFAVVHDARHPFTVLAHNLQINDVGTEFDVRAYDNDVRIAVARGSVLVGAGRGNGAIGYARHSMNSGTVSRTRPSSPQNTPTVFQEIPLSAGDVFDVANGVPTVTHHADIVNAMAWMQGRLVFQDEPLARVVGDLERTFNLTITVADTALLGRHVTASFGQEPIDEVLAAIALPLGAEAERAGYRVTIRRRVSVLQHSGPTNPVLPLNTAQMDHAHE